MSLFAPERTVTDRFVLRCYLPGDGPALQEATNASYQHLKRFMPWATEAQTVEEAESLARTFRANYLRGDDFVLAAFDLEGRSLVGGTGFHLREGPLAHACAETGMWVRAEMAHQGLGTAMLREMLRWGFTAWPWQRISWRCNVENQASMRVAEKAGLRREGTLRGMYDEVTGERRDVALYSALRSDP